MTTRIDRRHALFPSRICAIITTVLIASLLPLPGGPRTLIAQQFDVLLLGGTVVDGTGSPARDADVGVRGGVIAAVGDLSGASATRVIDARGLYVVPGFIDTHSHATWGLVKDELRTAHALLSEGVLTVLANPDGGGPVDLAAQRVDLLDPGVGVNVAQFIGHGSVRREVLGMQAREATPEELDRMRALVRRGMEEGAFGLSSGLYYSPGSYAPTGEGLEIYADQYPYEASGTSIVGALVPRWALAGGDDSFAARLSDEDERAHLVADMWENLDRRGGADRLVLQGGEYQGQSLQDVAEERALDPIETAIALLEEGGPTGLTSFNMNDDDIIRFMRQPWTMTSSDGILVALDEGHPHPRDFGAFARKIRKYVVRDGVVTLEQAIHSMTGLPAQVYKIEGRGVVAEGMAADIIVLDLEEFRDVATYDDPHHFSEGVEFALVNGVFAIDGGRFTDELAGEVLRKAR